VNLEIRKSGKRPGIPIRKEVHVESWKTGKNLELSDSVPDFLISKFSLVGV